MKVSRFFIFLLVLFILAGIIYFFTTPRGNEIQLTGIVTGNEVIVSPQIAGRLQTLLVDEGSPVKAGQLIAELDPRDQQAALKAAEDNIHTLQARLTQSTETRSLDDSQTSASLRQAQAALTATNAQLEQARATLWQTGETYKRQKGLADQGVVPLQARDDADAAHRVAEANVKAAEDQVRASQAQVGVAEANRKQVTVQESDMAATRAELAQAVEQKNQAEIQLIYTKIYAPLDGIVSIRAARQGEMVVQGGPIVTVLDVDHLWVQADVEESYADQISFAQKLKVRLPSGNEVEGAVFFKGVENTFATQRDVSRTKRDIKTFSIKVSIANPDRKLFAGMTAYVLLPPAANPQSRFHF
jgi:multidrug resistance efflux pump